MTNLKDSLRLLTIEKIVFNQIAPLHLTCSDRSVSERSVWLARLLHVQ